MKETGIILHFTDKNIAKGNRYDTSGHNMV